jgi:hypothetical protein
MLCSAAPSSTGPTRDATRCSRFSKRPSGFSDFGGHFRYVHQLEDSGARIAFLEFATEVDGRQVEGIDKLTFDEHGRITELKVMLRPASALQVVGTRMGEEFAHLGLTST